MNKPTTDYWAAHLYLSPRQRPKADQPVRDLPPRAAQRFKKAREQLRSLGLPRVIKQAVRDGSLFDGVRHCWMEFADLDAVQAFAEVVRLKYQLLARPE